MTTKAAPQNGVEETLNLVLISLEKNQSDLKQVTTFLGELIATETERDKAAQNTQIKEIIQRDSANIKTQVTEMVERWKHPCPLTDKPDLANYASILAELENKWQSIDSQALTNLTDAAKGADLTTVRNLLKRCKELRRAISLFTIPQQIGPLLRVRFGVGAPLDFHKEFKDELEDPNDRVAILQHLAELDVNKIGGMIEIERGTIYRIGSRKRRLWSYILILVAPVLALGLLFLNIPATLNLPGFVGETPYTFSQLLTPYFLTILGVVAHIIKKTSELASVERPQGAEEQPLVVLDRLFYWIHVREYRFVLAVIFAIGAFILLAISGQLSNINALMAGYTVDSLSDLVLQRFNKAVSSQAGAVKKALSVP